MSPDPQLEAAILAGDVGGVRRLLALGADANAITEGRGYVSLGPGSGLVTPRRTALMLAAWSGHREIAKLLLDRSARVNARDGYGRTPLMAAAMAGRAEIVTLLLEHGAELDAVACETETALYWAATQGHADTVRLLLGTGARVNGTAAGGATGRPLEQAIQSGHPEVVRLLVETGAPLETRDGRGWTPLMHASFAGQSAVAQALLELGAESTLVDAAARGDLARLPTHLADGAPIDGPDPQGHAPLYHAAQKGHAEVARLLLDHGADPEAREGEALTTAVTYGHPDVVRILLRHGARIPDGGTQLLMTAASGGDAAVVRLLLEHGVDAAARSTHGFTALHCAAAVGDLDTVSLLLTHGVDVNVRDEEGRTALTAALEEEQDEVAQLLRNAGAVE